MKANIIETLCIDIVLSTFPVLSLSSLLRLRIKNVTIISSIFQMRKPKQKAIRWPAEGHRL